MFRQSEAPNVGTVRDGEMEGKVAAVVVVVVGQPWNDCSVIAVACLPNYWTKARVGRSLLLLAAA